MFHSPFSYTYIIYENNLKITSSKNMTLSISGLKSLCVYGSDIPFNFLDKFYLKWKEDSLVIEKWFELMSILNVEGQGLNFINDLLSHEAFEYKNPNKIRSVLGTFQRENVLLFHANNSSGYNFISNQVRLIDKNNPLPVFIDDNEDFLSA